MQQQKTTIRLVTLNVGEGQFHERIKKFLTKEVFEVLCFQGVLESEIKEFEDVFQAQAFFTPMYHLQNNTSDTAVGLATLSRLPFKSTQAAYYVGDSSSIPLVEDIRQVTTIRSKERRVVQICDVEKNGLLFRVASTHFTWTPDGKPNDRQREDLRKLLHIIKQARELVLCGDFNAPRGGEIFTALSSHLQDNVPLEIESTLDPELHTLKDSLPLVVDGIFSSHSYVINDVSITTGVSDHVALSCTVSKHA